MQFASKMMLVPFNKDNRCINKRSESEKILKSKKLSNTQKLTSYRSTIERERENEKRSETRHDPDDQEEAAPDSVEQIQAYEQEATTKETNDETKTSQVEKELYEKLQQLQQRLHEEQEQQQKLQKEHDLQVRRSKAKSLQLRELQSRIGISTDERPSKKRKVLNLPVEQPKALDVLVTEPKVTTSEPKVPLASSVAKSPFQFTYTPSPIKKRGRKILNLTNVHKLDVMPEEADPNPSLPAFGVYNRQFVAPDKRVTRAALKWKQY